jgi:predicted transcriptional regulator
MQLQYTASMKTATLPGIRVEPELRSEAESVLNDGETLSQFVETSVRDAVRRRRTQAAFIARGLASLDAVRRGEPTVSADSVLAELEAKLASALKSRSNRKR